MNIPKELCYYITNSPTVTKESIYKEVDTIGIHETFINHIKHIDVKNSYVQTIDFIYKIDITKLIEAIDYAKIKHYIDNNQANDYINIILEKHQSNLDYESYNPPVVYEKTSKRNKKSNSKTNTTSKVKKSIKQNIKFNSFNIKIAK